IGNDPSRWRTGIRQYKKVVNTGVYPGIDAIFYVGGSKIEFDLNVQPGCDPEMIRLAYDGIQDLHLTATRDLAFTLGGREIIQRRPVAYQELNDGRIPISANYRIVLANQVEIEIGSYDRSLFLVLDPVLEYGTFFGGSGSDGANALAVDSSG